VRILPYVQAKLEISCVILSLSVSGEGKMREKFALIIKRNQPFISNDVKGTHVSVHMHAQVLFTHLTRFLYSFIKSCVSLIRLKYNLKN
jgi:hypothetical protein